MNLATGNNQQDVIVIKQPIEEKAEEDMESWGNRNKRAIVIGIVLLLVVLGIIMVFVFQNDGEKSSVVKAKKEKEKKSVFESSDKVTSETDEELNEQDKGVKTTEEKKLTADEQKKLDEMIARMKERMDNENNYVEKRAPYVKQIVDQAINDVKKDNQAQNNKSLVQSSQPNQTQGENHRNII